MLPSPVGKHAEAVWGTALPCCGPRICKPGYVMYFVAAVFTIRNPFHVVVAIVTIGNSSVWRPLASEFRNISQFGGRELQSRPITKFGGRGLRTSQPRVWCQETP